MEIAKENGKSGFRIYLFSMSLVCSYMEITH